jgi:hypothetical protein
MHLLCFAAFIRLFGFSLPSAGLGWRRVLLSIAGNQEYDAHGQEEVRKTPV